MESVLRGYHSDCAEWSILDSSAVSVGDTGLTVLGQQEEGAAIGTNMGKTMVSLRPGNASIAGANVSTSVIADDRQP